METPDSGIGSSSPLQDIFQLAQAAWLGYKEINAPGQRNFDIQSIDRVGYRNRNALVFVAAPQYPESFDTANNKDTLILSVVSFIINDLCLNVRLLNQKRAKR